jgi:enoyl-CoA hydratase
MFEYIKLETEGPLAYIILNRPEKLNALNTQLMDEIDDALNKMELNDQVKVIIIKAEGKGFSVGYDLDPSDYIRRKPLPVDVDRKRLQRNIERWFKIWEYPKPVISQVHGYCIAGGTQLALLCDLTIVAEDASFGVPSLPVGAGYIAPFWNWFIGPKKAKEVAFRPGSKISGKEAVDLGMANYAFKFDELEEKTKEIALDIARVPADFLLIEKLAINRQMEIRGFKTSLLNSAEWDTLSHSSEGVKYWTGKIRELGLKEAIKLYQVGENY